MHRWSCLQAGTHAVAGLAAAALTTFTVLAGAGGALAGSSAWTIVKSPNATLSGGRLESVSCSSRGACTAVGNDLNKSGINVTLAERWNGTSWHRQSTPNPPGNTSPAVAPDLLGVSCPASNFCEAVGTYHLGSANVSIAEAWNGRRWSWQQVPVPPGSDSAGLNSVSCVSSGFCEAVGSYQSAVGTTLLAARWNGTSWRLQLPPSPAGAQFEAFSAVSCASATFCEAWGGGNPGAPGPAVAERWNGKSWRMQVVPSSAAMNSVSCVAASFCEAVGSTGGEVWDGSHWSAQAIAGPASASLLGVSCVSSTFCEAVGAGPSAAVWNGAAWSAQSPPNPARSAFTHLNAVSCAAASSCEAAGYFEVGVTADNPKALAEVWNGHTWQLQAAVKPPGATDNTLAAVSCVSSTFCEAVGSHFNSAGNQVNLAEMWNGTSWKLQAVPNQTSQFAPTSGSLFGVSCVTASFCEAVGVGAAGAEAELWNGTSWQLQPLPGPSVQPMSVSCVSTTFCLEADGFGQVAIWDGSSWSAGPAVTGFSPIAGVSCVSATICEAVGSGPSGENAAEWNGTSWTAQPTLGPVSSFLSAVSCAAADSCEAVGSSANSAFQEATFAEAWNGSAWSVQSIPNPKASQGSFLNAVWCTTSNSCTAAGDYRYFGGSFTNTLAEVWDGAKWSLRSTPNHAYAAQNVLSGVSCGAPAVCTAVGQTQDIGGTEATLIETGD
jgi:hypothetical protein